MTCGKTVVIALRSLRRKPAALSVDHTREHHRDAAVIILVASATGVKAASTRSSASWQPDHHHPGHRRGAGGGEPATSPDQDVGALQDKQRPRTSSR